MFSKLNCTTCVMIGFPEVTTRLLKYKELVLTIFVALYLVVALMVVCSHFFIPALERLCYKRNLPYNIAGATLLTASTSAPEFLLQVTGVFKSNDTSDVGILIGSTLVNLLGIGAICGFLMKEGMSLDWWPITRDISWYIISWTALAVSAKDAVVSWYEAFCMILLYLINLSNLLLDPTIQNCIRKPETKRSEWFEPSRPVPDRIGTIQRDPQEYDIEVHYNLWRFPAKQSLWNQFCWILVWPAEAMFFATIPDCRYKWARSLYPFELLICTLWIGVISYTLAWLLAMLGSRMFLPDGLVRVVFQAIGTCIPEAITSAVVSKKGYGSMGMCTAINSNTFDILVCLGLPWSFRAMKDLYTNKEKQNSVFINSRTMIYETITIISTVAVFYVSFMSTRFTLDRRIGVIHLIAFVILFTLACCLEVFVFGMLRRKWTT